MDKGPVTQAWTHGITFMQQTVLLTAVRGPDGLPKYGAIKMLLRWYRRCILVSSLDGEVLTTPHDPRGGSFMGPSYSGGALAEAIGKHWSESMDEILDGYLRDLDAIPHHFQLHLMHAFEIVGYKHPDLMIRAWFRTAYERLVRDMHLRPETEADMDDRLGDDRSRWLAHADRATAA